MKPTAIGVLTPSSNTILEPATSAMVGALNGVSAHFARFAVTKIALSADSDAQFEFEPMLTAAELLADARVGVIAWSGTSASWLGFGRDEALCEAIAKRTGIPACAAVSAINEMLVSRGARRIALVTPYTEDVHQRIIANYRTVGIEVVDGRYSGQSDNFSFALLEDNAIKEMCRALAPHRPEAIVLMCTNMRGWSFMRDLEEELEIQVIDSTAAVVRKSLNLLGVNIRPLQHLGSMFA